MERAFGELYIESFNNFTLKIRVCEYFISGVNENSEILINYNIIQISSKFLVTFFSKNEIIVKLLKFSTTLSLFSASYNNENLFKTGLLIFKFAREWPLSLPL